MTTPDERLAAARLSLEGLSVGDAFGERFFMHADTARALSHSRALPKAPWTYTDDTNMALSIYAILKHNGAIEQDTLAASYAQHYHPDRGYGPTMHRVMARIAAGEDWRTVAGALFDGQGSYGNGAAMRVAPLGAYFADDMHKVIEQARLSSEITHAHEEGIAGGIAVAVAAAIAWTIRNEPAPARADFLDRVLPHVPASEVKSGIQRARDLRTADVDHVVEIVGSGYRISAQDTVPFALWCAAERLSHYEDALWLTAAGLGDVDTNCAIVGGIVALYAGEELIPPEWIANREPLPDWAFN